MLSLRFPPRIPSLFMYYHVTVASVGSPVVAYDPGLVLLEGPLFKVSAPSSPVPPCLPSPCIPFPHFYILMDVLLHQQVSGTFGRKSWKLRWTALVPNALLSFSSDSLPKPGAVAKDVVVLEHATLEGVDEIEAKRPFVFCVGSEGKVRALLHRLPCALCVHWQCAAHVFRIFFCNA